MDTKSYKDIFKKIKCSEISNWTLQWIFKNMKSGKRLKIENLQLLFQAAVRDVLQRPDCDNDDDDDDDISYRYVLIAVKAYDGGDFGDDKSYQS